MVEIGGPALVIMGKAPRPGATKTRLTPPLTPTQAAALYEAFLLDTTATGLSLGWGSVTLVYPPEPDAETRLRALLPAGVMLRPQGGVGLGEALAGAAAAVLADGFAPAIIISSDTPTLSAATLRSAASTLHSGAADLALGPSPDGGYYLIGLPRHYPSLFTDMPWSTSAVYLETLARATTLGLRVHALPPHPDVDTIEDLARLRADLRGLPAEVAPATRAALARSFPLEEQ